MPNSGVPKFACADDEGRVRRLEDWRIRQTDKVEDHGKRLGVVEGKVDGLLMSVGTLNVKIGMVVFLAGGLGGAVVALAELILRR